MASFVRSVLGLLSSRPEAKARPDEEQAATTTAESVFGSSTLPPSHTHTGNRIPADDALTLFRLTLGITAAPHLGFSLSAHRPADNVGLYARVVRNEQTAKSSYKIFSLIINACYFLQIIVAASLTAMGAASANNRAITAFGAINTVIAGFLTYLKGSGYPARYKYCADEWKKVREFVEHRERDFSLESCTLDVHEEIDVVRDMYETTKRDVEINNPEAYNAKTSAAPGRYDIGVDRTKADAIAGKLRGFDDKLRKMTGHATAAAGGVQEKSDDVAVKLRSLEDSLARMSKQMEKTADDSRDAARSAVDNAVDDVEKRALAEFRGLGKAAVRGMEEYRPRAPREVSITVANRDDDGPGNEIEVVGKK
ncbi:hypothetical protein F5144DRAFT_229844 [Chaetomium tenue]|uniref:Uncharacterized protein n=1 Tax=Chaetomium tenue TaxID=1854479 RepID=A0ACB7P6U7_9PEZI|nr:hypothetical protein F5144DRAFT_229844 [Chaetomium globosum]